MGRSSRNAEASEPVASADHPAAHLEENVFGSGQFGDLGLVQRLADHLHGPMGFKSPTVVQQSAIPLLLSGRDVLVNARTGTGKTIVYLAPIVHSLQAQEPKITRDNGTYAMILVPTRELCIQVCAVTEQLVHRFHWLVPGHVMGGENRAKEKARLRKGITILVATPGRLLDHLRNTASFCFENLQWLVFDEADRLLDMGFQTDIESILDLLNTVKHEGNKTRRQHVLLSATLNESVNRLAKISLSKPATIGFSRPNLKHAQSETGVTTTKMQLEVSPAQEYTEYSISENLHQSVVKVSSKIRLVALLALLRFKINNARGGYKIVVFFSTCDAVDFHYATMRKFHWSIDNEHVGKPEQEKFLTCDIFKLHGNAAQKERTETFHGFSQAQTALLLCTDVAARGLDFQGLNFIVQYDPPGEAVDYVHRVGRTARLGQRGEAVLFLQPSESDYVIELQRHGVLLKEFTARKVLDYIYIGTRKRKREDSDIPELHPGAIFLQKALESFIASKVDLKQLAVDAFRSSIRAYAAHRGSLKRIFQVKSLHLGHVARSFGLQDAPALLGKSAMQKSAKKTKMTTHKKMKKKGRLRAAKMME